MASGKGNLSKSMLQFTEKLNNRLESLVSRVQILEHGKEDSQQCRTSFFLNPTACSSGCNRMPKSGIWLGLRYKLNMKK